MNKRNKGTAILSLCTTEVSNRPEEEETMSEQNDQEREVTRFEALPIPQIFGDLSWDNCALRAFGALLESADMDEFSGTPQHARELRTGLRQIVELYVDRQERKLNELQMKTMNSCERIIGDAKLTYEMVDGGAYSDRGVELEKIRIALNGLNLVIAKYGDEYPQASVIRDKLMKLRDAIGNRKKNAGE